MQCRIAPSASPHCPEVGRSSDHRAPEGLTPFEVSRLIGLKPNAVAALTYRSRRGLREAYLEAEGRSAAAELRCAG